MSNRREKVHVVLSIAFCALLPFATGTARSSQCGNSGLRNDRVHVEGGSIAGVSDTQLGVRVFKGIPYAAPPVGELRWRAPAPVVPWKGVRKADTFAASCTQPLMRRTDIMYDGPHRISEDCLYLNVWTSAKSSQERRPVLLWVHPGGMTFGEGSGTAYDGEALSKKGLVVVTINYRMGIFGTLAHPELSRESANKVSGNYALLDMIAAIKWTRRNITAFGGDPTRITLYGESAGGRAVSALSTSPLIRGEIHGVIAGDTIYAHLGGTARLADAERAGSEFTKTAGASSIEDLRRMPANTLMEAASTYRYRGFEFVDDGWALSGDVFDAQKSGAQQDIPILTGITANFSTSFLDPVSSSTFVDRSRKRFGELADRYLALYPGSSDDEAAESQRASANDSTAWIHTEWAAARAKAGHRAYLYLFTHTIPTPRDARTLFNSDAPLPERLGAWHVGEIPYAFDSLAKLDREWAPADYRLADIISSYWANFATSGDPNGPGLPLWPAYGGQTDSVMELGDQVRPIQSALQKAKSEFWAEYFYRPSSQEQPYPRPPAPPVQSPPDKSRADQRGNRGYDGATPGNACVSIPRRTRRADVARTGAAGSPPPH